MKSISIVVSRVARFVFVCWCAGAVSPGQTGTVSGMQASPGSSPLSSPGSSPRSWNRLLREAFVKASNPGGDDDFGKSIAADGDTIVVGARSEDSSAVGANGDQDDDSASNSGAAYVFVRRGSTWTQEAYLKASNTEQGDAFGGAVAVSGDTIVVGAPFEDGGSTGVDGDESDNSAPLSGAAYVFVRNGTTWTQQAYLKPSNTDAGDRFGESVAISGETIVIGATGERSNTVLINGDQANNNLPRAGAVYVFVRNGTTWSQEAYVKPFNTAPDDLFGASVAISGDTVAVGAYQQDNDSPFFSGAAYAFVRTGTSWAQQAYLKASNAGADDHFGWSVAVHGDRLLVGAPQEESAATGVNGNQNDDSLHQAGAAYLFERVGTTWSQEAYLKPRDTNIGYDFGWSVALEGDTLAIGSPGKSFSQPANGTGLVNRFLRSGSTWVAHPRRLRSIDSQFGAFGYAIAMSGDLVAAGAHKESSLATGSGAALVFDSPLRRPFASPGLSSACATAAVDDRNAGINPRSYTAAEAFLGGHLEGTCDLTTTGHQLAWFFAFESPSQVTLSGGQTLLCLDQGRGELLTGAGVGPFLGPKATFRLPVPSDASLCGTTLHTQAVHVLGVVPFALSNAQDIRLGL